MGNLPWEEYSCAPIKLSTIKERFGQEITRELLGLESGFSAVRVCVERADGFFDIFIDIRVVGIFCI
jgi:hypothetical protein